jgi:hypothetical protein
MTLNQIERPPEKWIQSFRIGMVGQDRIRGNPDA